MHRSRREVLAGSLCVFAIGCLDRNRTLAEPVDLLMRNHSEHERRIDVRIDALDERTVFENAYTLDPRGEYLETTVLTRAGRYTVLANGPETDEETLRWEATDDARLCGRIDVHALGTDRLVVGVPHCRYPNTDRDAADS
ncbi:MAG: hypothetical protein ACQETB_02710 [Halobacteriota archaeon]